MEFVTIVGASAVGITLLIQKSTLLHHQVPTHSSTNRRRVNSFVGPKGEWFYFSDTQFHKVDVKQVLGSEGYILFYERVADPNQKPTPVPSQNDRLPSDDFEYDPSQFAD
jgi:hypothetical protein